MNLRLWLALHLGLPIVNPEGGSPLFYTGACFSCKGALGEACSIVNRKSKMFYSFREICEEITPILAARPAANRRQSTAFVPQRPKAGGAGALPAWQLCLSKMLFTQHSLSGLNELFLFVLRKKQLPPERGFEPHLNYFAFDDAPL